MKSLTQGKILSRQIMHNNTKREYLLYIPTDYSRKNKSPITLNFHGHGGAASEYINYSDWRTLSDNHSFILIYPQGQELEKGGTHWNPDPISIDSKSSSDDLGFIEKLINKISKKYSVDTSRIYATGFSNGAGMAYGLARHRSDLFAGIAPVSGLANEKYSSTNSEITPVGLISFNGSEDWVRPVEGIQGYLASTAKTSNFWSVANNSEDIQLETIEHKPGRQIEKTSYFREDGVATIEQYIIERGGHEWFHLDVEGRNLSELAWDFLSRLSKEENELVITPESSIDVLIPDSFRRRVIDEIINFDSAIDILKIDTDSYGIDRSATFASGKNMKTVKKKLDKQGFDFLYDQKKGNLYFNENGAEKGFGDGGIVAILQGSPELTDENFYFA